MQGCKVNEGAEAWGAREVGRERVSRPTEQAEGERREQRREGELNGRTSQGRRHHPKVDCDS